MKRSALCLVDTETQADAIVGKLRSAGFSDDDISVLFPDKGSTRDFAHKKETKMPEGATIGASTGGAIGGTIGLLAGIGALAIPGLGRLSPIRKTAQIWSDSFAVEKDSLHR